LKLSIQHVLCNWNGVVGVGGGHELPGLAGNQTLLLHQPREAFFTALDAGCLQITMDARTIIATIIFLEEFTDVRG
jgi:hypothetical protein